MGNLLNTLKKFIANKNTVTILGVLAGIVVLYIGYNYRVNQKVKFVEVIYAKETIEGNTQITEKQIGTVKINAELLNTSSNVVQNIAGIKDVNGEFFFVNYNCTIPAGGFVYKDLVIAKADKADSKFYDRISEGYRLYTLKVDLSTTLGNSITPGNSIDIYINAINDLQQVVYEKFMENIEVLDVVDNKWATTAGSEDKNPALLLFSVTEENYLLLSKAESIKSNSIKLVPVPNHKAFAETDKETKVVNEGLRSLILSKSASGD